MSFCPKCGSQLNEGSNFCNKCGANLSNGDTPKATETQSTSIPVQSSVPMKWFKFLIYFSLWASAVLNIANGIGYLTGEIYETNDKVLKLFYKMYPAIETADIVYGIFCIALAFLCIYTRFQLATFKKSGPKLVNILYLSIAVATLIYVVFVAITLDNTNFIDEAYYLPFFVNLAMASANATYFKKRQHLFVR